MCVNLWYQQNGHFVCISLKAKYPYFVSTMHHPPSQFIASEPTFSLSGRHISPCMPTHNPLLSQIFSLSQRGVHFYVFPSSRSDQQPVQPPIDHRLWHCSRCCPVSTTSLLGQSRRLRRPPRRHHHNRSAKIIHPSFLLARCSRTQPASHCGATGFSSGGFSAASHTLTPIGDGGAEPLAEVPSRRSVRYESWTTVGWLGGKRSPPDDGGFQFSFCFGSRIMWKSRGPRPEPLGTAAE